MSGSDADKLIELLERLVAACEAIARPANAAPVCRRPESSRRLPPTPADISENGNAELPLELTTAQAAEILGVSKDTVLEYRSKGLLPYRDTSPPGSSKPVFVYPRDAVVRIRTTYQCETPSAKRPAEPPRRPIKGHRRYKHLDIDD